LVVLFSKVIKNYVGDPLDNYALKTWTKPQSTNPSF